MKLLQSRAANGVAALGVVLTVGALVPAAVGAEELPPKFREAVEQFLAGNFKECQIAFGQAAAEAPRAGLAARAAYGAACCAAVRNDVDGGFEAISLALANGFVDLERALIDPRLETLRADSRWFQFVALLEERQQAHQKSLDPDLLRLYLEQRADRAAPSRDLQIAPPGSASSRGDGQAAGLSAAPDPALLERGAARRKEAWDLVARGRAKKPEDAFHAAFLLVESPRLAEVEKAGELARQACARDPDLLAARPLVATAVDRAQMLAGRPQKYGTQLVEEGGSWKVYDIDPAVNDAERAEWGVPPLAEAEAQVAELNRRAAGQAPPAMPPAAPAAPPKP